MSGSGRSSAPAESGQRPIEACEPCLRRGHLLGRLAEPIACLLADGRPAPGLLALDDGELAAVVAGAGAPVPDPLERFNADAARHELERRSLAAVCRHCASYPQRLLDLTDPPHALFVAGDARLLARASVEPAVAIVGTRRPSPYGLEMAYELGRGLGAVGVTVVSGLALGIDASAHRGCVDADGPALAVLAGGPDVPYPRTNGGLYTRVVARGAVVSELPPGQRAHRWSFPARNRIMAALASVVVVVEAADPSGSLITAGFAGQLGRTVAAVPGRATSRFSAGSNRLLKDGARVVTSAQDVLEELYGVGLPDAPASLDAAAAEVTFERGLGALEQRALDAVEAGLGVDELCAHVGLPVREARALLSRLESSGHLRRDGLGVYRRAAATPRRASARD